MSAAFQRAILSIKYIHPTLEWLTMLENMYKLARIAAPGTN
jgi:hypothetical protein